MIAHDAAAKAVVALAGKALAAHEASVAAALVRHVLALAVYALGEELDGAHVVAGDEDPRRLLQALADQGQRQGGRRLAEVRAARLLLAVVRVEIKVAAGLTHAVAWKTCWDMTCE